MPEAAAQQEAEEQRRLPVLALAALGIVYGDIGTSPLYAFRQALSGLQPTSPNVLGILSLIVWALIIVISLKYLVLVMKADNKGEGGILALLALLNPWRGGETRGKTMLIVSDEDDRIGSGCEAEFLNRHRNGMRFAHEAKRLVDLLDAETGMVFQRQRLRLLVEKDLACKGRLACCGRRVHVCLSDLR